jgi:NDP-sugar pyrophosphorylase family protein
MKAVILAGGLGTRLAEETLLRPKPMVEIGGKPILRHIMKGYAHHGITDFVICLGNKGHMVREYLANPAPHDSAVNSAGNHARRSIWHCATRQGGTRPGRRMMTCVERR